MKKLFHFTLLVLTVFAFNSCDKKQDPELPDLIAPALTYFRINGDEVIHDTIHLSRDAEFTLAFNFNDNVTVAEGEFSLIINNLEDLSKTIDKGPGQRNYKYTLGLLNLQTINHLKGASSYTVQPNDQIKFTIRAVDPSNNLKERSIIVIVI